MFSRRVVFINILALSPSINFELTALFCTKTEGIDTWVIFTYKTRANYFKYFKLIHDIQNIIVSQLIL